MRTLAGIALLCFYFDAPGVFPQTVQPHIVTETNFQRKVAVVEVAPRFVTTVRLPNAVNSIVVGDPSRFQVEHSDREPKLVFVKSTWTEPAETNLLISMANGRQVSLLLVSRGENLSGDSDPVDFLLRLEPEGNFFVLPSAFPSELVGETVSLSDARPVARSLVRQPPSPERVGTVASQMSLGAAIPSRPAFNSTLDQLLDQQESAPLPALYGERITEQPISGDAVRAGVGRVIDAGHQVVVLFSAVNPTKHAILLMPPQVQLSGRITSGKLFHRKKWSSAEQLPVLDYRLSRLRVGAGGRADGVLIFERPPYKQSNETLLLQVAESGAVDRPALAPIGFGITTSPEDSHGRAK
jgi:hypothetical protein